ncbi:MAG TPA: carboxypeptidase-like regulatory domain-containing protein [Polyangiaceae bacterium]|nr:carboxypeptidase-like regulatory domain-containing protein [Polyangiaceae bacterium]
MRSKLTPSIAIALLCCNLAACGDDNNKTTGSGSGGQSGNNSHGGTGGKGNSSEPPLVVPAEPGTVFGIVTDIGTGAAVAGAEVIAGDQTATTDAKGSFSIEGLDAGDVTLAINAEGYAPAFASAVIGETTQPVLAHLKKQGEPQSYSADTAQTLSQKTEAGPYAVIFEPNSLDTDDTDLTVSITPLDPTKERDALPGLLLSGGKTPSLLVPVTFAEFTILDSSGKRVNLKPSASAQVELPIPPQLRADYPLDTKIHCYAYDPATGKWEDFVEGTVQVSSVDGTSPVLAASVRHFSWYGGAPQGNNCVDVYVKVVSAVDGKPLGNARVEASPGTSSYTDADGNALIRSAVGGATTSYTAYQTGLDVDGSLTGIKGAKYIEFGKVEEDLVGLTQKSCTGDPSATPGQKDVRGSQNNPLTLQVGRITGVLYQANAILTSGDGSTPGQIQVVVEEGIPGDDGTIVDPMPTSGAKVFFNEVGSSDAPLALTELAPNSGLYMSLTGATITAGKLYAVSIDGDGNGSIDGTGTAYALGAVEWTNPTDGASVKAANFTASWSDTGSKVGGAAYAPVYEAVISSTDSSDAAIYIGTDREFLVKSATMVDAPDLTPGTYTATVFGFSGAISNGSVSTSNNITGLGVTGQFYSMSSASNEITFTVK